MVKPTSNDVLSLIGRGPSSRILELLQRHGPMSAKQLQAALGVSSLNAVREPLLSLSAAGLVRAEPVRRGAGRPSYLYALTDKAQALFPKGYDVLLRLLLEELLAQHGRDALRAMLQRVGQRLAREYAGNAEGQAIEERLQALAAALDARGTPINIVETGDTIMLHEYCCPYYDVAQRTSDVCAIERQMLEQVLGRPVRLMRRIVDGHVDCQFMVEPPTAAGQTDDQRGSPCAVDPSAPAPRKRATDHC
ncbi:helix-turn-helix transcriptional regulator [Kallotenue papyrolyticum]|uniref:helix-turn-helix transcriptional regulator n=1 Tax=Kallotenue papyrolyticum TaxID=1325125 RepID=UPI0004785D81|nr:transcriptional regulator [Kallotenue papyrolyticum]